MASPLKYPAAGVDKCSVNREHPVQRIVLPSGKSIDIVRVDDRPAAPAQEGLHICRNCESELVQPVDWHAAEDDHWEITLRCPNCSWSICAVYTHEQIIALEEQMDLGVESIVRDLRRS